MWKIIRTLAVKGSSPVIKHLWKCAEGMASVPDGLDGLIQAGSIAHMLGIIFNAPGHQGGFQNRLAAVSFLSKFLWNPVKGTEASNYLRRWVFYVLLKYLFDMEFLWCIGFYRSLLCCSCDPKPATCRCSCWMMCAKILNSFGRQRCRERYEAL